VLIDGGTMGIYHRSFAFEVVIRGIEALVSSAGVDQQPQRVFFSPVQVRSTLERSGYVTSFPNLIGVVAGLPDGAAASVARDQTDWMDQLEPTEVSLCSAACHGLYPVLENTTFPAEGARFEAQCWCFRHEPSEDPARMQTFRQHEFVCIGPPEVALAHRDEWLRRGLELLKSLGLDVEPVVANDPFFGRTAPMMAESQRDKELKYELVAEVATAEPRAISSANYHEAHFGEAFALHLDDGSAAHTACIGFGLERIALALFRRHGPEIEQWPTDVVERLAAPRLAGTPWSASR
jgi:seryl-tRNA synthetase